MDNSKDLSLIGLEFIGAPWSCQSDDQNHDHRKLAPG